jgi:hypothetical protein
MADHDSTFIASGGTLAQTIREGGVALVDVDVVLPSKGLATVTVQASAPVAGVDPIARPALSLIARANPYVPNTGPLEVAWAMPHASDVTLEVLDLQGRRVATLVHGMEPAGAHESSWDGHADDGTLVPPAM